jgi:hypothetical protein
LTLNQDYGIILVLKLEIVPKMTKIKEMPLTYDLFKEACKSRGYSRVVFEEKHHLYAMWTKNGIKAEVSRQTATLCYTIGWGRSPEEIELLAEEVQSKDFSILKQNRDFIRVNIKNHTDVMPDFWILVELLEGIDGILAKSRGIATKVFTKDEDETDKFEKIAGRYFYAIENKDQELLDLARELLSGDSIDRIITRGESVNRTETDSYREHIVPCIMIHNEAIRMVLDGSPRTEVAQMIASNLAIVRITKSEADLLDHKLKLKTTMPEDWNFGDDVFARLNVAKIQLK